MNRKRLIRIICGAVAVVLIVTAALFALRLVRKNGLEKAEKSAIENEVLQMEADVITPEDISYDSIVAENGAIGAATMLGNGTISFVITGANTVFWDVSKIDGVSSSIENASNEETTILLSLDDVELEKTQIEIAASVTGQVFILDVEGTNGRLAYLGGTAGMRQTSVAYQKGFVDETKLVDKLSFPEGVTVAGMGTDIIGSDDAGNDITSTIVLCYIGTKHYGVYVSDNMTLADFEKKLLSVYNNTNSERDIAKLDIVNITKDGKQIGVCEIAGEAMCFWQSGDVVYATQVALGMSAEATAENFATEILPLVK